MNSIMNNKNKELIKSKFNLTLTLKKQDDEYEMDEAHIHDFTKGEPRFPLNPSFNFGKGEPISDSFNFGKGEPISDSFNFGKGEPISDSFNSEPMSPSFNFGKNDLDSIQNFYIEDDKKNIHPDTYVYRGDHLLSSSNANKLTKLYLNTKTIYICTYQLITDHIKPFVMFLLQKNEETNVLGLPTIAVSETLVEDALKKMNIFFSNKEHVKLTYKGFIDNDGSNIYIILEYKDDHKHLKNNWYWALSTEIVNYKKLLNFAIDYNVTRFFLNNIELLFINNKSGHQYECPSVGYYNDDYNYTSLAFSLGRTRNDELNATFGPFYYFDTEAKEKAKEKEKGGLVRFALFTGKIKVFEDNNNNNWVEDYDSLLANKGQLIVVKTRDQQIPLTHYRV